MTKTFGILAYPAGHSLSPAMHNAAFAELRIDAKYKFFEKSPEELEGFIQEVRDKHIDGLSVSIPHKEKIIPLLDEVEDSAKKIGAVNTVFWRDGKLVGANTDWFGFLNALNMFCIHRSKKKIGKKVVVLGGGGAARAIVFALLGENYNVVVVTREAWGFKGIKKDFDTATDLISNLEDYDPDVLVNATPLGMKGRLEGKSFVPTKYFEKHQPLVFDIVYNPRETQLLKDAKAAGCETAEGLNMLVWQAMGQLKLWLPPEKSQTANTVEFVKKMFEVVVAGI